MKTCKHCGGELVQPDVERNGQKHFNPYTCISALKARAERAEAAIATERDAAAEAELASVLVLLGGGDPAESESEDMATAVVDAIFALRAERDALRAELDAALEMLKQTTDGLNAYRQVAERVGALNVLPGASWDTPDPKPVGRVEVLVLREAVWCDDVEEWEDTQTDKCLRTVVAWRPGRAAPGDGGEEAG